MDRRGQILEFALRLESYLDSILLHYFPKPGTEKQFWDNVLHNEKCTVSFKFEIIKKIGILDNQYDGIKRDIQRVFEIRNIAAHSYSVFGTQEALVYSKNPENLKKLFSEMTDLLNKIYPAMENALLIYLKPSSK